MSLLDNEKNIEEEYEKAEAIRDSKREDGEISPRDKMKTKGEVTKEFPLGEEDYCPKWYFENGMVVLRKDCSHNKEQYMGKNKTRPLFITVTMAKRLQEFLDDFGQDFGKYYPNKVTFTLKLKDFIERFDQP